MTIGKFNQIRPHRDPHNDHLQVFGVSDLERGRLSVNVLGEDGHQLGGTSFQTKIDGTWGPITALILQNIPLQKLILQLKPKGENEILDEQIFEWEGYEKTKPITLPQDLVEGGTEKSIAELISDVTKKLSSDIRETIICTEEKLRDLIYSVMVREYGVEWELDTQKSWKGEKITQLKNRMKDRQKEFPTKQVSNRLIDFSYIMDLKTVITKNEKIFKPIFQPWNELMGLFDILGKYRDPQMHSTTALKDYEKKLCEGICGRFNEIVEHWLKGYLRKTQLYSCDYIFDVLEGNDPEAAKKKALDDANLWLDKIKQQSLGVIGSEDIPGRGEALIIKFKEGIAKITLPTTTRQYYGEYTQAGRIHVVSDKFDVLDKVVSLGNTKYWCLTWIVEGLDVAKVVSRVFELEGKTPPNGRSDFQRYVLSDGSMKIRIDLQHDSSSNLTRINLVFDGGEIGKGFLKAHQIFSPDLILSMLYHEIQPIEIRKLIEKTINP